MGKIIFKDNIKVFGIEVKSFPAGISDAFNELIQKTGDRAGERDYFGVSSMNNEGKMIYKAVAGEKFEGEGEKYNYPQGDIEKGTYLFTTLKDWRTKTECIKDIFYEMIQDVHADKAKPCVEWYKNDDEMLCMVKAI